MKHKRIHEDVITVNGKTMGENCAASPKPDNDVIWSYDKPLVADAGFLVLRGNLFDSAIMKTSVISKEFRDRYLINPKDPNAFEGRAIVFEGPEDYHHRIDDASLDIDEHCILFVRGTGPIGYPGGAEVVNMQPPAALIKRGILSLPCIGDGRQSGTSAGSDDQTPSTLRTHIVKVVRAQIMSGKYRPGERLNESQIAREFNVSRIPVREASVAAYRNRAS
jgi:dihydroxy-acid dehydratase